ncbi:MAG TPA: Rrf2 family transcriptional regulator [Vicinamibacterales bacterium]|nr:Rrf2 family transcriptional regulator [Vicinamibacterales bacterium]
MLRLSKKADYALIAMRHLAAGEGGSSASAREIAESYAIPPELLAKVLQRLVRAGLLVSVQGTRGGYKLVRDAQRMTVADVIQAIDGPVAVTACSPSDQACEQYQRCEIRDPLWKIKTRIVDALATVSLAELAEPAAAAPPVAAPLVMHAAGRIQAAGK